MFGGVIRPDKASVNWCGRQITDRRCFAATGDNQEIQFNVEDQAHNVVVLIDPGTLGKTVGKKAAELLRATKHLDFGDSGAPLIHAVMEMLARCEQQPQLLASPAIIARATSLLLRHVEECFASLDLKRMEEGRGSRGDIVHKAVLHVHQAEEATSAWGMAQAVGVSQKTLELAFREVMDITPGHYLVLARLNDAHHALACADRASTKVTDVALGLGFTHMGRFAKAYNDLFGELPSQTLKKSGA